MTNDYQGGNDPSVFDPDPYDPVVAERFQLLDAVEGPEPGLASTAPMAVAVASNGSRGRFAVAVAASAAIVVAALGVFMTSIGGDDGSSDIAGQAIEGSADDEADQGPEESGLGSASGVADGDGQDGVSVLEVEGQSVVDGGVDDGDQLGGGDDDDGDTDGASDETTTTTSGRSDADGNTGSSSSTTANTIAPPTYPSDPPDTVTDPVPRPVPPVPPPGELVRMVSGKVTEVMVDCVEHLVLDDNGKVVRSDNVLCDGGSYIVVDGIRIFTTSGFGLAEDYYNKHPEYIKPGQRVTVIAREVRPGVMVLDCDTCTIQMG